LALSVPCIISDIGVEKIISSPLSDEEMELLNKSASVIKEAISQLKN
jgi:malate/lactate dehydrogenase